MSEDSAPQGRPRLNLKPRDESAAKQLEIQRTASGKVWGGATPAVSARLEVESLGVQNVSSLIYIHDQLDPKSAASPWALHAATSGNNSSSDCNWLFQPEQQSHVLTFTCVCRTRSEMPSHERKCLPRAQARARRRS
jgi:hypothetical protein